MNIRLLLAALAMYLCSGCAALGLYERATGQDVIAEAQMRRYDDPFRTRYQDYIACVQAMPYGFTWDTLDECMKSKGYVVK